MLVSYKGSFMEVGFFLVFNKRGADLGIYAGRDGADAINTMLYDAGAPDDAEVNPDLDTRPIDETTLDLTEREALIQMWREC